MIYKEVWDSYSPQSELFNNENKPLLRIRYTCVCIHIC